MARRGQNKLDPMRQSALLMLALEEDTAAEVFTFLSATEIQNLGKAMATVGNVSHEQLVSVIEAFKSETEEYTALNMHSGDHIRLVLEKALGPERAAGILDDILEAKTTYSGIDTLNLLESPTVAEMIRDEHPQIIATILVHLERTQASEVIGYFDESLRSDLILRISTFSGVQPAALQELTEVLGSMLEGQHLKRAKMGGVQTAAEILNMLPSSEEDRIIETVRDYDEDLARQIIDEMFLFENLLDLDNQAIQLILKEVEQETLVIALKGAEPELAELFFSNMSKRGADMLKDDLESRGPVRVSQVESEQKTILGVVRRLADSGAIIIGGGGDEFI